jgi:hypothetical protein
MSSVFLVSPSQCCHHLSISLHANESGVVSSIGLVGGEGEGAGCRIHTICMKLSFHIDMSRFGPGMRKLVRAYGRLSFERHYIFIQFSNCWIVVFVICFFLQKLKALSSPSSITSLIVTWFFE